MSIQDLLKAAELKKKAEAEKPKLELVESVKTHVEAEIPEPTQRTLPTQRTQHKIPNVTNPTYPTNPTSPEKDFTKVPNSIARVAVPERLFKGMSKNTYDALYQKTRGAINPVRKIRATRSDLLRWVGVSDLTIDRHIKHLKSVGLLKVELVIGSHDGNWYEVLIPEEINHPNVPNVPYQPNQPNEPTEVSNVPTNLVSNVGRVDLLENKEVTETSNTLLKTNTNDDELMRKINDFFRAKFGRELTEKERQNLPRIIADLLVAEFEQAAAKTNSITDAAAFFSEHLRRKLANSIDKKTNSTVKSKSIPITPVIVEAYEAEPLSHEGRQNALAALRTMRDNNEPIEIYKESYSETDWQYLITELEK